MGQNAKSATSGTCNDTTLGLITVLGVIDPDSGCVISLGKLLLGRLGARIQRLTRCAKSTKTAQTGKREIRTPDELGLDARHVWLDRTNKYDSNKEPAES